MAKSATTTASPAPSKMERAKKLYQEITSKPCPEGKTYRGIFQARAHEINLSAAAANTYFQNLKSEAEGKGRYPYSSSTQRNQTPAEAAAPMSEAEHIKKLETQVSKLNRTVNKLAKIIEDKVAA